MASKQQPQQPPNKTTEEAPASSSVVYPVVEKFTYGERVVTRYTYENGTVRVDH